MFSGAASVAILHPRLEGMKQSCPLRFAEAFRKLPVAELLPLHVSRKPAPQPWNRGQDLFAHGAQDNPLSRPARPNRIDSNGA